MTDAATRLARLVECVPNVSEGRRPGVVEEIVAAVAGADPGVGWSGRGGPRPGGPPGGWWACPAPATPTTTGPS